MADTDSSATPAEEEIVSVESSAPMPTVREQRTTKQKSESATITGKPVFKIQILTSGRKLPAKSKQFKGLTPVDSYEENGIIKYTYGADTNYNKILRLKRTKVDSKFKDAFIIAFKDGQKMNINQAIREFKRNR